MEYTWFFRAKSKPTTSSQPSKPISASTSAENLAQKEKEVVNKIAVKRKAPPPQANKKQKKDMPPQIDTQSDAAQAAHSSSQVAIYYMCCLETIRVFWKPICELACNNPIKIYLKLSKYLENFALLQGKCLYLP